MVATEMIWETYHERLSTFIRKYVAESTDVDDVLQEVFVKVHTHIATLREEEKLRSWVYQIARNAIMDYYRQRRQMEPIEQIEHVQVIEEDDSVFENAAHELAPCIQEMVEQLPTKYRQALLLTEYEGLTQKELSTRLGISFSGAKSRVQRARTLLKNMLLTCCNFQFDRLNHVIDYQPRHDCCEPEACCVNA